MPFVNSSLAQLRPSNLHLHRQDFVWTLKSYQELGRFTDVDLYCKGGRKLSVHRGILCQLSPFVSQILSQQACCCCLGQECQKRAENVGISLADIDAESVARFLEIIYTGRTNFASLEEKSKVESVLKALKVQIPSSSFSLEHEFSDGNSPPTIHLEPLRGRRDQSSYAEEAAPTGTKEKGNAKPNVEPAPFLDNASIDRDGKRQCPKCGDRYSNKYQLFERHFGKCTGVQAAAGDKMSEADQNLDVEQQEDEVVNSQEKVVVRPEQVAAKKQTPTASSTSVGETRAVNGQDRNFESSDRIIRKPAASAVSSSQEEAVGSLDRAARRPISAATGMDGKKECPKCGKFYDTATGWYQRHRKYNCPLDHGEVLDENDYDPDQDDEGRINNTGMEDFGTSEEIDGDIVDDFSDTIDNLDQQFTEEANQNGEAFGVGPTTSSSVVINGKKKCPKCAKFYDIAKGWYKRHRHFNCKLDVGEVDEDMNTISPSALHKMEEKHQAHAHAQATATAHFQGDKRQCKNCSRFISVNGGWYTKHVQHCQQQEQQQQHSVDPDVPVDPLSGDAAEHQEEGEDGDAAGGRKKQCSKCHQFISVHGGRFLSHGKTCRALDVADDEGPARRKEKCTKCFQFFSLNGGWYSKHVKMCKGNLQADKQQQQQSNGRNCPRCNRFITLTSGWYMRHVRSCKVVPKIAAASAASTAAQPSSTMFRGDINGCRFCGKEYDSQHLWHFQQHQIKCSMNPSNAAANIPSTSAMAAAAATSAGISKASPQSKAIICFFCQSPFQTKAKLKMHMVNHYRREVRTDYMQDSTGNICTACPFQECDYESNKSEHMLVHVSLKHNKLRQYLPPIEAERLFPAAEGDAAAAAAAAAAVETEDDIDELPTGTKRRGEENLDDPSKRARLSDSALPILQCTTCSLQYHSKSLFKQHLFCHYKQEIRRKYVLPGESDRKCSFCEYVTDKPDNLVQHLALTHKKLQEFLPTHLSAALFPAQVTFASPQAPLPPTAPQKPVPAKAAVKKLHRCPICKITVALFYHFKMHLCKHFVAEITDALGEQPGKKCQLCPFEGTSTNHLVFHMGTKHNLLLTVVSTDLRKMLIDGENASKPPTGKPSSSSRNGGGGAMAMMDEDAFDPPPLQIQSTASLAQNGFQNGAQDDDVFDEDIEEVFHCEKCLAYFQTHLELTRHMTLVNCKKAGNSSSSSSKQSTGRKGCHLCPEQFLSYVTYKSHLLIHFEEVLERELASLYDSVPDGKCNICGQKCKTLHLFVRHLSVDHDRIINYLPVDVREAMRDEFGIDPEALSKKGRRNYAKVASFANCAGPSQAEILDDMEDDISTIILGETEEEIGMDEANQQFPAGEIKIEREDYDEEDQRQEDDMVLNISTEEAGDSAAAAGVAPGAGQTNSGQESQQPTAAAASALGSSATGSDKAVGNVKEH